MNDFLRHLRHATRVFVRAPGFSITVVLTLAAGVAANIAVFSTIDSVLLRPLPFPNGDRLMSVSQTVESSGETSIAPIRLEDWRRDSSTFESMTGYYVEDVTETSGEFPRNVRRAAVAPHFLEVLGTVPILGRGFTEAEHEGLPSVVLVSDYYWREQLASDRDVLNRSVRIGMQSFAIVGVVDVRFPSDDIEFWVPAAVNTPFGQSRQAAWYTGVARIMPGVSLSQARADLALVQSQLAAKYPNTDRHIGAHVVPLKETVVGRAGRSLWLVFGAVSVLLLITCTNVATLFLTRAAQRAFEVSIRRSYGASVQSIISQSLLEAGVLVAVGSAIGIAIASIAIELFRVLAAGIIPRITEVSFGGRTATYTLVAAIAVTLVSGLVPAIRSAYTDFAGQLAGAGRAHVSTKHALHWFLVAVQIGLSVMLLSGAGLLLRSFQELSRADLGFEPSRILTFRVSGTFADMTEWKRFQQRIGNNLDELGALPGIAAAATSATLPGVPTQYEAEFALSERRSETDVRLIAEQRPVSPSYFATLGIALLDGEPCQRNSDNDHDLMVNRAFVDRYLSGSPAVGRALNGVSEGSRTGRILGVVGDTRERGLDQEPAPTVYWCTNANGPAPYFLVRTTGEPVSVYDAIRQKLRELEPLRAVYDIAPLEQRIGGAFAENRMRTVLLALFAATALVLACVGVYGTLSYFVSLRRREVGLRLALGGRPYHIIMRLLWRVLRVVGVGCIAGLAVTYAFGQALAGMLYGVSPFDPSTFFGVVVTVVAVAVLGALVPAIRAGSVDPMTVLREE